MVRSTGRPVAKVLYDGGSEDPQVGANALLIADAPDLLQVCYEVRDGLRAFGLAVILNDLDTDPRVAEAIKHLEGLGARLDAVIAKAEGE